MRLGDKSERRRDQSMEGRHKALNSTVLLMMKLTTGSPLILPILLIVEPALESERENRLKPPSRLRSGTPRSRDNQSCRTVLLHPPKQTQCSPQISFRAQHPQVGHRTVPFESSTASSRSKTSSGNTTLLRFPTTFSRVMSFIVLRGKSTMLQERGRRLRDPFAGASRLASNNSGRIL